MARQDNETFAGDRGRASEADRKGGQMSQAKAHGKSGQQSGGNSANDPRRAAEAGRKGGEHSGGGKHSDENRR